MATHKENFSVVQDLLKSNYTYTEGTVIPKKHDLTFDNKYKIVKDATVVYMDMRHSRKVLFDQNEYKSLKTHRAFLQSFISCIDYQDGHFRSFNGDGALAFFNGNNASARAVKACMDFKKYIQETNTILENKDMQIIDYGIGIARGKIYVAKTGRKGDDSTRQDLVWVGYPTYLAVELSNLGKKPNNLYISNAVYKRIHNEEKSFSANILTDNSTGKSIWTHTSVTTSNNNSETAYKTSYWFKLELV